MHADWILIYVMWTFVFFLCWIHKKMLLLLYSICSKVGIRSLCIPLSRRLVLKCFKYHILAQEFNYRFQCPPPLSPAPLLPPQVSRIYTVFIALSCQLISFLDMKWRALRQILFLALSTKINMRKLTGGRKDPPFSYDSKPGNLFLVSVGRDR